MYVEDFIDELETRTSYKKIPDEFVPLVKAGLNKGYNKHRIYDLLVDKYSLKISKTLFYAECKKLGL